MPLADARRILVLPRISTPPPSDLGAKAGALSFL
jgi:hypothetical protein